MSSILKDLELRRSKYGSLGCLDFLIEYEKTGRSANDKNVSFESGSKKDINNVKFTMSTPLKEDVKHFRHETATGQKIERQLLTRAKETLDVKQKQLTVCEIDQLVNGDPENHPEINLFKANMALNNGNEKEWLKYLNNYLSSQDISQLHIEEKPDSDLFYRVNSTARRAIYNGPKVSVIIPAFNAEKTIEHAVKSILNQSWKNLEIIVIDDCSTDATWSMLSKLSQEDDRLLIYKNAANTGPYVAKNLGLKIATGDYITGHDADDWSHPERIEKQMAYISHYQVPVNMSYMVRMQESGYFSHMGNRTSFSPDGALRKASISCLFEKKFFDEHLGYWDCVRFGADSELMARTQIALGKDVLEAPFTSMLCLDLETGLTNHPEFGIDRTSKGVGPRHDYKKNFTKWHETLSIGKTKLNFNQGRLFFDAPEKAKVKQESIVKATRKYGL